MGDEYLGIVVADAGQSTRFTNNAALNALVLSAAAARPLALCALLAVVALAVEE